MKCLEQEPYLPCQKNKPINVQEELKKGALQLKQEVAGLLSLYGGTFSPNFDIKPSAKLWEINSNPRIMSSNGFNRKEPNTFKDYVSKGKI